MEIPLNGPETSKERRDKSRWANAREAMVRIQLIARGIRDPRVLDAMGRLPRHNFVPEIFQDEAYSDRALPIGSAQTISQPYMVALSLEALGLKGREKVLEIGAGSGYVTALLAELAGTVRAIERLPDLTEAARERLEALGYTNFLMRTADGTYGWPDDAPFDAILAAASAPKPPLPWLEQLAPGGCLIAPVGGESGQVLVRYEKDGDGKISEPKQLTGCVFVKLIGRFGWNEES